MKTILNTVFATISERKIILGLRGLLLILFIGINTVSFSQTYTNNDYNQVNNIRYGLFNTCTSTWLAEPTRRTTVDALEDLAVYKANHPDNICMMVTAKGFARIDVSKKWQNKVIIDTLYIHTIDTVLVHKEAEIDTIYASRRLDVDGNIVRGYRDMVIDSTAYIMFKNYGMIHFKHNHIYHRQKDYKFKRIKDFGTIRYENLDIPFQFVKLKLSNITSSGAKIEINFTEKITSLKGFVDGKLFKTFTKPYSVKKAQNNWYAWFTVNSNNGLKPDTVYTLTIEATSKSELTKIREIKFKTLD